MPVLEEILERVGPCNVLSKIDLSKGYYQVAMAEGSRQYTAFASPFGKFEFTRMPFGLRNVPAVFQRLMDHRATNFVHRISMMCSSSQETSLT